MIASVKENIQDWMDDSKVLKAIEKFLNGSWFLALFAIFIFVEQALGGDLVGFSVCAALIVYICLFCKNTNASVPVLCMATFCVSTKNSPAYNASAFRLLGKCYYTYGTASDFYGSPQFWLTASVLIAMVVTAMLFRLIVFGNFKRAFSFKGVLWSIVLMSLGFVLAGCTKDPEDSKLLFGVIQAATFFLIYFFYASTLDFKSFTLDRIADIMLTVMFYIIALIGYIYATRFYGFLSISSEWKEAIYSGWGMSLDFGAYLAMTVPACLYKMLRSGKWHAIWLWFALVDIAAIYFVMARGALVAAAIVFVVGLIFLLRKKELRKTIIVTLIGCACLIVGLLVVLYQTDTWQYFFNYFIHKGEGGGDITSGRLTIWDRYCGYFMENPIFGGGFGADLEYQASILGNPKNGVFNIYSYLAHNVLIQSIGSCGIVGTITLFIHFGWVLKTFFTKPNFNRGFLGLAILAFLGMSLLDTIFYKAQFTFLYLALIVACEADMYRREKIMAKRDKKRREPRPLAENEKPRVVFAFVEAGMGHIMPETSLADAFENKYGDRCTVVRSRFFNETENKSLMRLEKSFVNEVKKYNHNWLYGWFNMFLMYVFGSKFLSKIIMDVYIPGTKKAAREHMAELKADMVVSTHWSTNYYAENMPEHKPITVTYIPDVQTIPLFRYPTDMTLMSAERGYKRALKRHKRLYNADNIRLVSFALRKEAFALSTDKKENRRALGLDEEKMTVVLFEGGYGLGRMGKIASLLVERDLPMNVIAICGKNEKLHQQLLGLQTKGNLNLIVEGFCAKTLEYLAAADVFVGKSGASSVAEATYFGTAIIVTKYATSQERDNGEYYLEDVQNALQIFNAQHVVDKLASWLDDPTELHALQANARGYRNRYGSEKSADVLWELLCKRYPSLQGGKNETAMTESRAVQGLTKKNKSGKTGEKNAIG